MQKLNVTEPDTTLLQRRFLVLGSSFIVLWFWIEGFVFLLFHVSEPARYPVSWIFTPAAIISFICQYRLYRLNATRIASASDGEIDESQKMVRDQAYRRAYQISIWITLITLFLIILSLSMNQHAGGIILPSVGLLWSMLLLPTWVVAWTAWSR